MQWTALALTCQGSSQCKAVSWGGDWGLWDTPYCYTAMKKEEYDFRADGWWPVFAVEFGVKRAMLEASTLDICKVKGIKVPPSFVTVNQSQKCFRECKRGKINRTMSFLFCIVHLWISLVQGTDVVWTCQKSVNCIMTNSCSCITEVTRQLSLCTAGHQANACWSTSPSPCSPHS